VGPANCGKSTLFNRLTGLNQTVANYPGVTVEQRVGKLRLGGCSVQLMDLPGISGMTARSDDERVTLDVLLGTIPGQGRPDAVIVVIDATALERHLAALAPVLALGLPALLLLNMSDELRRGGGAIDTDALSRRVGVPAELICAKNGQGLDIVRRFLSDMGEQTAGGRNVPQDVSRRRIWASQTASDAGFRRPRRSAWTDRLDAAALHPMAGPALFALVLIAVFQSITVVAKPLQDLCEAAVQLSGAWIATALPASFVRDLLAEGVWPGVGSVLAFLPQILILFLFIGILEDSGYLTRAAVISDRTMARFGLQGKSFIPLLSAYACAIPAIMATRTIANKRDRLATILIAPFMTCSARLPVYTMIIAAFIPERPLLGPFLGTRAAAMLGLYVLGLLGALGTAWLLQSTVLRKTSSCFLMEMPPYRWPSVRGLALRLLDRAKVFLGSAGTTILAVSVVLWLLAHVPIRDGHFSSMDRSVVGMAGRGLEPVLRPLGFNGKIGIGLITSLVAREAIVGTLGTLYGIEGSTESAGLGSALHRDLTPGGAAALVVFFAFALQCFSTIAVVRRETGSWKWPAIQFGYMTALAYLAAWATNCLVSAAFG
jgi:ferrous iron transport protein B